MRVRVTLGADEPAPTLEAVTEALKKAGLKPGKHEHAPEVSPFRAMRELEERANAIWDEEMKRLLAEVSAALSTP